MKGKTTRHTADTYFAKYIGGQLNASLNRLFRYLRMLKKEQEK